MFPIWPDRDLNQKPPIPVTNALPLDQLAGPILNFKNTIVFTGTSSADTGPTYDHTYGTNYGRYMHIEASSPRVTGDKARLISRPYTQSETNGTSAECLTFYYHMFGYYMGTLNVYKVSGSDASGDNLGKPIWTKSGDQGNYWQIAQVSS